MSDDDRDDERTTRMAGPLDRYIGGRITARRRQLGMSETQLGVMCGVGRATVERWERGTNRTWPSRLLHLSNIFGVPVGWFFEGFPTADVPESSLPDPMALLAEPGVWELVEAFVAIPKSKRKVILEMVQTQALAAASAR